jgi:ADP-ribosylglycohydrolase
VGFVSLDQVLDSLRAVLDDKDEQGHDTSGLRDRLVGPLTSVDTGLALAEAAARLPLRDGWPYDEPSDLASIRAAADPHRVTDALAPITTADAAGRVRAGFLGSVCGCILGKPVEINPTLDQLRVALTAIGDWPLDDYISERLTTHGGFPAFNPTWPETVRERIRYVAPDDDINYTVLGYLVLHEHGLGFTRDQLARTWLGNLVPGCTYGPERTILARLTQASVRRTAVDLDTIADELNPGEEFCGAMIRADAYGYACPSRPELAAELAWRDAGLTHRRTGIYGAMFAAAAIATAFVGRDPLEVFATAARYIPQRSRFRESVEIGLEEVAASADWLDGYRRINARLGRFGHCRIHQETATLVNTLRWAESVGHGICLQVSQGNDTDSYGATAGALLGTWFGPGHLDERWLAPFQDEIRTLLAGWYESSLARTADHLATLPRLTLDDPGVGVSESDRFGSHPSL